MPVTLNTNSKVTSHILNVYIREGKDVLLSIDGKTYCIVISPLFGELHNVKHPYRNIILMENNSALYNAKVKDKNMDAEKWLIDALKSIGKDYHKLEIILL